MRLWAFDSGGVRVVGGASYPQCVGFTPDGSDLAWNDEPGLTFWNVNSNDVRKLKMSVLARFRFAPDGRTVAAGGGGVVNTQTGKLLRIDLGRLGRRSTVTAVAFSTDGKTLATNHWIQHLGESGEHFIRLTEPATGREQGRIVGHGPSPHPSPSVPMAAFSPHPAVSSSGRGTWQVANLWRTIGSVDRLHFQVVAFTPDGRYLGGVPTTERHASWTRQPGVNMSLLIGRSVRW